MSTFAEQLEKLRERERHLQREGRKIEFLRHIGQSASEYNHKTFADVKDDVNVLLANFIEKAISSIETEQPLIISVGQAPAAQPVAAQTQQQTPAQQHQQHIKSMVEQELSPSEKLSFAMDNRHLAGKRVMVENDKNIEIRGEVVGLDAPFVHVKTDTGPIIKVPLAKVSLS